MLEDASEETSRPLITALTERGDAAKRALSDAGVFTPIAEVRAWRHFGRSRSFARAPLDASRPFRIVRRKHGVRRRVEMFCSARSKKGIAAARIVVARVWIARALVRSRDRLISIADVAELFDSGDGDEDIANLTFGYDLFKAMFRPACPDAAIRARVTACALEAELVDRCVLEWNVIELDVT